MSVRLIRCDHCGHAFQIDARHIGLVVECPNCDGSILIREAVKPPPPPPAAPPEPPLG